MAVMGVWAFILFTGHRWHKTKEQKTMTQYQEDFPWTEKKEVICFTSSMCSTQSLAGIWNPLISGQMVNSFGQGKCSLDCQSGNLKKKQAHTRWELKNWSPSTVLVCGHFIQIHSCMSICFSCMYTKNYEHFHKWFGIFYRDNSVLMRVPHDQ